MKRALYPDRFARCADRRIRPVPPHAIAITAVAPLRSGGRSRAAQRVGDERAQPLGPSAPKVPQRSPPEPARAAYLRQHGHANARLTARQFAHHRVALRCGHARPASDFVARAPAALAQAVRTDRADVDARADDRLRRDDGDEIGQRHAAAQSVVSFALRKSGTGPFQPSSGPSSCASRCGRGARSGRGARASRRGLASRAGLSSRGAAAGRSSAAASARAGYAYAAGMRPRVDRSAGSSVAPS